MVAHNRRSIGFTSTAFNLIENYSFTYSTAELSPWLWFEQAKVNRFSQWYFFVQYTHVKWITKATSLHGLGISRYDHYIYLWTVSRNCLFSLLMVVLEVEINRMQKCVIFKSIVRVLTEWSMIIPWLALICFMCGVDNIKLLHFSICRYLYFSL